MFQNYTLKAKKILSMDTLSSVWYSTVPKRWLGKRGHIYSSALHSCPSLWRYSSEAEITAFMKLDIIYLLVLLQFIY